MFKKFLENKTARLYVTYALSFILTVLIIVLMVRVLKVGDFFTTMENNTFDLRQNLSVQNGYKKPSKNIVLITIDDPSYEYLLGKYGEWPIPREVYAKLINYVEAQNPKAIAFDLMFVKSMKSSHAGDSALVNAMNKYDNIFTAMNFDNQPEDVRKAVKLPEKLSVNVENNSKVDFSKELTFSNCRTILTKIIDGRANVGMINVSRSKDGILREMPPLLIYQGKFFPHMSLLAGIDYLKKTENAKAEFFVLDKNSNLKVANRKIPVDKEGGAVLNWYGPAGETFEQVPFYKVDKAVNGDKESLKYNFKNKIVLVGTTAVSLFDTKSVPVSKIYPGVEVHATYINNIIDNNFIKKVPAAVDILISAALALFVGFIVIRTISTAVALWTVVLTTFGYLVLSYLLMVFFNLWVGIILPLSSVFLIFVSAYIVKYLLKSRDFEHQYKLATTDGLTELYNHRFFQEQMIMNIENCKRYNSHFSLILIDIDFFKKFNDTYGHQAGDAVLKQVAQTLKKNVRATDIVCRYGGEEMSIILPNTDREEAIFTAQKICQAVAQKPFKLGSDLEKNVTISLGVATYPQDGNSPTELIEKSDQGLYKAKENGRNQVGL